MEIGQEVHFVGGDLYEAVNAGIADGYVGGYLRKSSVDDPLFVRKNTGDNTPAIIHTTIVPGEQVKITVSPKGCGSENMGALKMLKPADGVEGVIKFVVDTVRNAGPNPCPPVTVGVGIGGNMEKAALLAKYSLTRKVGEHNPNPQYAELEKELLKRVNMTGVGPSGLGGSTTAVAVNIEYAPTHIGGLPIAVNLNCHAASLILLAAVLFMPEYNGCRRWLVIPGFGTLQPSEIAKFAVVLVFSHIIALNHDRMKDFSVGVLPFALVLGVVAALMLLEPHLSGTVLILGIGAVLMFVGGTGLRWFLLAGAGGVGAIGAAVAVMPDLVPYAADRLRSWLDPFADPLGDGHQTIQSLYAIGSGGATGLGLGESHQKHLFVPEPQNDFIFSIVCEELGFVGACAVVGLFVLLLCRGITIAAHAPDRFGALLVVGFVVQVALQAVLNVAVVTNTIPNTGISLPFFSSGGTSLMMLLGEMGVVLGVSRGEA